MRAGATIKDDDPYDPLLLDDFESTPALWHAGSGVTLSNPEIAADSPDAVPGQGAYEHVLRADTPILVTIDVKGRVCNQGNGVIPVTLLSTPTFDATTVDPATVMFGDAHEAHTVKGVAKKHVADANHDGRKDVVFHFRFKDTGFACDATVTPFTGETYDGTAITNGGPAATFVRDLPIGQDWTGTGASTSGSTARQRRPGDVTSRTTALPTRARTAGTWRGPTSSTTPPARRRTPKWAYEIGDATPTATRLGQRGAGVLHRRPRQCSTDGDGNLVITLDEADGSQECYYGPCEFDLGTADHPNKAEFAYGRIESRLQLADRRRRPLAGVLEPRHRHHLHPVAPARRDRRHGVRQPDPRRGLRHHPRPRLQRRGVFSGIYDFSDLSASTSSTTRTPSSGSPTSSPGTSTASSTTRRPRRMWSETSGCSRTRSSCCSTSPSAATSVAPSTGQHVTAGDAGRLRAGLPGPRYGRALRGDRSSTTSPAGSRSPFRSRLRPEREQPAGAPDDGLGLDEVWGYGFTLPVPW